MVEIGYILLTAALQIDTKISQSPVCFKTYHTFMKKMRGFLAAALLILQITTSLCQLRKTIKVLKFPKIGKFGGFDKPVAIHDFDPGDRKEATTCMKIRTFAYNIGFGCPFYLHTNGDWAEARDLFIWLYCVGWKTGIEEDDNKQVGILKLLFLHDDISYYYYYIYYICGFVGVSGKMITCSSFFKARFEMCSEMYQNCFDKKTM